MHGKPKRGDLTETRHASNNNLLAMIIAILSAACLIAAAVHVLRHDARIGTSRRC
jgi:hypothetical protein